MSSITISGIDFAHLAASVDGKMNLHYSGRGMMGQTCPAIHHDQPSLLYLGYQICEYMGIGEEDGEAAEWLCSHARHDNLGRGWVIYWPDLEVRLEPERPRLRVASAPRPTTIEDLFDNSY